MGPFRDVRRTVCLVMIVKDESKTIGRCLDSVRKYIDYWVICDTGSEDDTADLIQAALADIEGELHHDDWVDFGNNRSLALKRAKGKADYLLLMNADETLNVAAEFRESLFADAYLIKHQDGHDEYWVEKLINGSRNWRFVGATHEYLEGDGPIHKEKCAPIHLFHHADGGSRANKYERDIRLLTKALEADPNNARQTFYLAQSYRDSGEYAKALPLYLKRTEMGGWEEEVWYAGYQVARMQELLKTPWPTVLDSYLAAYQYRPTRLEPTFQIAKHYRETQEFQAAYLFAQTYLTMTYPDDCMFVERSVYQYELATEFAICCYWVGRHDEAIRVNDAILATPNLPDVYFINAQRNKQFSVHALRGG